MRMRRVVLLAALAAATSAGSARAGAAPGSSYPWTHSLLPVGPVLVEPWKGSSYQWQQPGTAPVFTPDAMPLGV